MNEMEQNGRSERGMRHGIDLEVSTPIEMQEPRTEPISQKEVEAPKEKRVRKTKKEKKPKKEKVKKERGQGKGSVLLYVLGSLVIPYLFILLMGLMDSLALFRMNVYIIVLISVLIFIAMLAMAIRTWRTKRKKTV